MKYIILIAFLLILSAGCKKKQDEPKRKVLFISHQTIPGDNDSTVNFIDKREEMQMDEGEHLIKHVEAAAVPSIWDDKVDVTISYSLPGDAMLYSHTLYSEGKKVHDIDIVIP